MTTRRISALASEGVECIHRGHYKSAIFALRHAIASLKTNFDSACNEAGPASTSHPLKMLSSMHAPLPLEPDDLQKMSMHNTFDVYSYTFTLTLPCLEAADLREYYHEITMGLFYNLGLAHHLAGLLDASESQNHLREAVSFYKYSLALLQSQDGSPRFETWCSFSLGLLNNMGHIFCHFCKTEQARACRDEIERLLESYEIPFLSVEEEEFFASILCGCPGLDLAPCA